MRIRDIREALAEALEGLGYRVYDVLPRDAQLPCAAVAWPDEVLYHRTGADGSDLTLTVTVAVSSSDFERAQRDIDDAMSTPGFGAAIEAFTTTAWETAVVTSASNIRQLGQPAALAADFTIDIYAP